MSLLLYILCTQISRNLFQVILKFSHVCRKTNMHRLFVLVGLTLNSRLYKPKNDPKFYYAPIKIIGTGIA
jgi:hypothetical protein